MIFKKSDPSAETKPKADMPAPWKVMIVDDEPEVHTITRLSLRDSVFLGRGLSWVSAYSGSEAREVLAAHPDVALIFLDVVMETDTAGLDLVGYIRETMGNRFVRIVLRTGQPGMAPERQVIVNYDINDYKEKTSFDANRLFSTTFTSLKDYDNIVNLDSARKQVERYRDGLEQVIESTRNLFEIRSLRKFANGVLHQLASLLHIDSETLILRVNAVTLAHRDNDLEIIAAFGPLTGGIQYDVAALPEPIQARIRRCLELRRNLFEDDAYVGYFPCKNGTVNLLYLDHLNVTDEIDMRLIEIFSRNMTVAFDNLYLDQEMFDTQAEMIDTLGDIVETRSKESANHVKRVEHLSRLLGELHGLDEAECQILFTAAPMHDVGKIGIPDRVLLKPGPLDADEWALMQRHAQIGADIFGRSARPMLRAASIIAGQHHERFDGSGYPAGLAGEAIHIFGRIVALTDTFDALCSRRCYKEPWPMEKVIAEIEGGKGRHFDPRLVELLLANMDRVMDIYSRYADPGQ